MIFCAEWFVDYVLAGLSSWVFPKEGMGVGVVLCTILLYVVI